MTVKAASQGFFKCYPSFFYPCKYRSEVALFTVGVGFFQLRRVFELDAVHAFVVNIDYFFMREVFFGKRGFYMTFICTAYFFCYGVVRELGNISVAISAGDVSVNSIGINVLINIIIPSFSLLINPSELTVLVAHEAVLLVGRFSLRNKEE